MPVENVAPTSIPKAATIIIILYGAALAPIAEFKKFTASLLTPTTRSEIANTKRIITKIK